MSETATMSDDLGQIAYEAYHDGDLLLEWETMTPRQQAMWTAAATAVAEVVTAKERQARGKR